MNAIELMNEEHKNILRIIKVVRKVCFNIMKGTEINYKDLEDIIEFIRNYADSHHHKKEEDILFNRITENLGQLGEKLVKHGMLVEHDYGRLYISNLVEAIEKVKGGDEEAKLDIIANAISYTHLMERHIDKEDRVVYTFAERNLKENILDEINSECLKFEDDNETVKNKLQEYITEEYPYYSQADIVVETRDEKVENTVKRVASAVHHFFNNTRKNMEK